MAGSKEGRKQWIPWQPPPLVVMETKCLAARASWSTVERVWDGGRGERDGRMEGSRREGESSLTSVGHR